MAVQRSRERGVQVKRTAVQRPFEGNDQGARGGQGVGWNRRRKMKSGGGDSGGEKLRKVSRQYPQKGNVRRQKAGCLGLEEG